MCLTPNSVLKRLNIVLELKKSKEIKYVEMA